MKPVSYLLVLVLSLISCSGTTKVSAQQEPVQDVTIHRLDKVLYNELKLPVMNVEELNTKINPYKSLVSALGKITIDETLEDNPATFWNDLQKYYNNPILNKVYKDALSTFYNIKVYEEQLSKAASIIQEEFEGKKLPALYIHVSGFRENVIVLDKTVSISIDKYLGSEYPLYKDYFQGYERQQMQPKYIARDYLRAWLMSEIMQPEENANMLSAMVYEGKVLYALSILLPDMDKNDIMGYTSAQSSWAKDNEKKTWRWLVKQNHLFSTDHMLITRFIVDSPYIHEISKESPGRLGAWLGWQMVKQYADKKGFLLKDILEMDAQTILEGAKYNP